MKTREARLSVAEVVSGTISSLEWDDKICGYE